MKKFILLIELAILQTGIITKTKAECTLSTYYDEIQDYGSDENNLPCGVCGEDCHWIIKDNVLKITGSGEMKNYDYFWSGGKGTSNSPFTNKYGTSGMSETISEIIIEGVSSVGDNAFTGLPATNVKIDDTVTKIGDGAFEDTEIKTLNIPDSITSVGNLSYSGIETLIISDQLNAVWDTYEFPSPINIICQGNYEECRKKVLKKLTPISEGGECPYDCPTTVNFSKATKEQCSDDYGWTGSSCSRKNADGSVPCASGFVEWDKQCWSEYPFAKKRWTPAEANEWLHDGNDNFVVITFKK